MAKDTDRLEPEEGQEYAVGSRAAQLFLTAVEQAFTDIDDTRRAESVRALRDDPQALGVARELYEAGHDDPMFRWGTVYVASEVGAAGTVDWLKGLAIEPLRELTAEERQLCETDRDSEVLVRVMAVEGLGQIVDSAGREAVYEALTEVIAAQDEPAIRSAAVVELVRLDPAARSQIRETLPSEHQHFADFEFKDAPNEVDERPSSLGLDPGESQQPPTADERGS